MVKKALMSKTQTQDQLKKSQSQQSFTKKRKAILEKTQRISSAQKRKFMLSPHDITPKMMLQQDTDYYHMLSNQKFTTPTVTGNRPLKKQQLTRSNVVSPNQFEQTQKPSTLQKHFTSTKLARSQTLKKKICLNSSKKFQQPILSSISNKNIQSKRSSIQTTRNEQNPSSKISKAQGLSRQQSSRLSNVSTARNNEKKPQSGIDSQKKTKATSSSKNSPRKHTNLLAANKKSSTMIDSTLKHCISSSKKQGSTIVQRIERIGSKQKLETPQSNTQKKHGTETFSPFDSKYKSELSDTKIMGEVNFSTDEKFEKNMSSPYLLENYVRQHQKESILDDMKTFMEDKAIEEPLLDTSHSKSGKKNNTSSIKKCKAKVMQHNHLSIVPAFKESAIEPLFKEIQKEKLKSRSKQFEFHDTKEGSQSKGSESQRNPLRSELQDDNVDQQQELILVNLPSGSKRRTRQPKQTNSRLQHSASQPSQEEEKNQPSQVPTLVNTTEQSSVKQLVIVSAKNTKLHRQESKKSPRFNIEDAMKPVLNHKKDSHHFLKRIKLNQSPLKQKPTQNQASRNKELCKSDSIKSQRTYERIQKATVERVKKCVTIKKTTVSKQDKHIAKTPNAKHNLISKIGVNQSPIPLNSTMSQNVITPSNHESLLLQLKSSETSNTNNSKSAGINFKNLDLLNKQADLYTQLLVEDTSQIVLQHSEKEDDMLSEPHEFRTMDDLDQLKQREFKIIKEIEKIKEIQQKEQQINQEIAKQICSPEVILSDYQVQKSDISDMLDLEEITIEREGSTQEISTDQQPFNCHTKQESLCSQNEFKTPFSKEQQELEEKYLSEVKEVNEDQEETPYTQNDKSNLTQSQSTMKQDNIRDNSQSPSKFQGSSKELVQKITDFYESKKATPRKEEKQLKLKEQKIKIQQNLIEECKETGYFYMGQIMQKRERRSKKERSQDASNSKTNKVSSLNASLTSNHQHMKNLSQINQCKIKPLELKEKAKKKVKAKKDDKQKENSSLLVKFTEVESPPKIKQDQFEVPASGETDRSLSKQLLNSDRIEVTTAYNNLPRPMKKESPFQIFTPSSSHIERTDDIQQIQKFDLGQDCEEVKVEETSSDVDLSAVNIKLKDKSSFQHKSKLNRSNTSKKMVTFNENLNTSIVIETYNQESPEEKSKVYANLFKFEARNTEMTEEEMEALLDLNQSF